MSLVVMGCSYKTASLEVREELTFAESEVEQALVELASYDSVSESAILATCNRIELYVDAKTDRIALDSLEDFVSSRLGGLFDRSMFYTDRGGAAAEHLFRVVCSLDSQVLGEAQILGQAKRAFEQATDAGTCGIVLTKLFKSALQLGKRVRTETGIGQDSVSLSTTAWKVAQAAFDDIPERAIVVIGTGEMARLALVYLADAGCSNVTIVGRSLSSANECAQICPGTVVPFDERYRVLGSADVVFTMTSAEGHVIEAEKLDACRRETGRSGERMLIIDEALPRDVEQACADLENVELHNLETLGAIIDEGTLERLAAVGDVERLVAEAEHDYLAWMQERQVTPTIKQIYEKANDTVASQVELAVKSLSSLNGRDATEEERKLLEDFGSAIAKKMLHGPTNRLRREAQSANSYYYTGAARYLFGLDTYPPGQAHVHCAHECEQGLECPNCVPAIHRERCAGGSMQ